MNKKSIYLETSFISYLAGRPSQDIIVSSHQIITHEWWDTNRRKYMLYVSDVVLEEAEAGDTDAARRRIQIIEKLNLLDTSDEAADLAEQLLAQSALPKKAAQDALHVAIAAVYKMHYLLTWNCKHIANVNKRHQIEDICWQKGYMAPWISTPEELMEED